MDRDALERLVTATGRAWELECRAASDEARAKQATLDAARSRDQATLATEDLNRLLAELASVAS